MTRFTVDMLPEAEAEFLQAFRWYHERSAMAADAFRADVFDRIDALSEDADAWPRSEYGIHSRILDRFPYTVHYDLTGSTATVLAVAHQRQRPGYWRQRISDTNRR